MLTKKSFLPLVGVLLLGVACVPQKKFVESQNKVAMLEDQNSQLQEETTSQRSKIAAQHKDIGQLETRIQVLQDTIAQLLAAQQSISARYADLLKTQEALQKGSQQEIRKLLSELQTNQEALQRKETELRALETAVNERNEAVGKLERDLQAQQERLISLENILRQKDSVANALKQKVSDALLNFEGKGLTVQLRNGKVYVSMSEKLLFASGSSVVDKRGADALKNLTSVLEKNPDISVLIEGHTDDVPYIGTGQLTDNWDLSCKRATSVVRLLLYGSKIEPSRITAAGRAEFVPLQKDKTPEARSVNRRIEVVLSPKLDEILKILED
ncbi:cell envelope biogenesis protein OmpA [Bacteroidia bacterium]|nr:cell envelope biogenesis protein OmpA [Bacteroidia bacterium]